MAYEVVMSYHLHMPSYFLGTFTEYPKENVKTTSALLGLSYRSFIKWKVPSVH